MAKKFKFHKGLRAQKAKAQQTVKPDNLLEPSHKMSADELARHLQREKQAGIKGKETHEARQQELAKRDRSNQW
jgi:ribosome modulation factor